LPAWQSEIARALRWHQIDRNRTYRNSLHGSGGDLGKRPVFRGIFLPLGQCADVILGA